MVKLTTRTQALKLLKDPDLDFSDNNYSIIRKWHLNGNVDFIKLAASHPTLKTPLDPKLDILKILIQALGPEVDLATEIKRTYREIESKKFPLQNELYSEWDSMIGLWVKNQPYVYDVGVDYQNSQRQYLSKNEYTDETIDGWLSNYFGFKKLNMRATKQLCSSKSLLYSNGRRFYYTKGLKIKDQKKSTLIGSNVISKQYEDLKKYNNAEIQLSALVCAQLTDGEEFSEIMKTSKN